ncbi:MAG: imelysin family protein [Bacteroidia bacterium]
MKTIQQLGGFILLMVTIGICSCGSDNTPEENNFDRKAMLTSVADNLIIPNFEQLNTSVVALSNQVDLLTQNPNIEQLKATQKAWKQAAIDQQHCSAFGFGPGNLLLGPYAEVLGVFPVNESKVEANILNPDFDLTNSFDKDVRGFYAVEYLLFGNETDSALLASITQERIDYLQLITNELKTTFTEVVNEWKNSYRGEFINNDGTSAGSSITLYYNSFLKDYENLKNYKVELPAGLTAGQSGPDSNLVEARYSGISRELIFEHFANARNIWAGETRNGEAIIGFDDYLETVIGGPELITQTREAFAKIDAAIEALPKGRISNYVSGEEMINLRDQLQNNTANIKSSMVSLLGLTITYNSGDGD